ncbi:autotransporter domain-containing protein [Fusobacterium necrophorum]|uniref:Autotransporter domain-containing protein n=1 Tax=Fusobacterium necrophorum TaxID=859 RepID=A0A4V1QY15_9FUSO|nr:autotransporter domain-containing protein [Fusobacterium necrophorum]RXZ71576.1 autotransporter domain-containing protein [Fusobacterium necrophorum]
MKKTMLVLCLAALASTSYGQSGKYKAPAHYPVWEAQNLFSTFEKGAYLNLLRVVDEINRQHGVSSNYLERGSDWFLKSADKVDLVPVAQFVGSGDSQFSESLPAGRDGRAYSTSQRVWSREEIKEKKEKREGFDSFSYTRQGNQKRFYFGNGNTVKDVIVENSEKYEKRKKSEEEKKNIQYQVEGIYQRYNGNINQLKMTIEDFNKHIKDKPREEILNYLKKEIQKKIPPKTGKVEIKDGQLITKDENGKEWRVLWSLEPVSELQTSYGTPKKIEYKDNIFTNIFIYEPLKEYEGKNNSAGKTFYTKDGSIIVEDKLKYNKEIIKVKEEKEVPKKDRKEFEKAYADYKKEMEKKEQEYAECVKKKEEAKQQRDRIQKILTDFRTEYEGKTEEEKKTYLEKHKGQEELIRQCEECCKIYKEMENKFLELYTEIGETIPKRYGLYCGWGANKEEACSKWMDYVVKNSDITVEYTGKNIEFRGQGRIEGTVDLGDGHNVLTIQEQYTGKYGTNIILGPKAKLQNIAVVEVGGEIGDSSHASLSGRTSLSLDIDPSVKNEKGNLIQHALKDSDKKIVFRPAGQLNSESRNDFSLELMTSRIAEDSTIDAGRPLHYQAKDKYDPAKTVDMHINLISDSIAHTLEEEGKKKEWVTSDEENTLLKVHVKEKLKKLTDDENEVYRSIRDAKKMNVLQPTLTTTNKKTIFSIVDDEREEKKKIDLIHSLKLAKTDEELEEAIKRNSQFHLPESKIKEAKMSAKIIQSGMVKTKEKTEEYKKLMSSQEYKELDLEKTLSALENLDPNDVWQKLGIWKESGNSLNESQKKEIRSKLEMAKELLSGYQGEGNKKIETLKKLANDCKNMDKLKEAHTRIETCQKDIEKCMECIEGEGKDTSALRNFFSTLNGLRTGLKEQISMTEKTIDAEKVKELEEYDNERKEFTTLKNLMYYTIREEEALSELKNILGQLQKRNIYSKLNKIAKDEISTYTNMPFDIDRSLFGKKTLYTRGGFLSSRTVQKNFKGNIYTGYGIYEDEYQKGLKLGAIVGGANTNYQEVYAKTLQTVATESTIKGVSAYAGAYANKSLNPQIEWISGLGLQLGHYSVKRDVRNNYQQLASKGRTMIGAANLYTGFVYSYPLPDDLIFRAKGILSYSFVHQGKIHEKNGLRLNINSQNYQYADGEMGISLSKTLYDDSKKSSLSAGVSGVFGLSGYKNKALNAKVANSSSSFSIHGDKVKKDAVKVHLDYNMQLDLGLNYGLEGTYITNSEQTDVKIGLKAGYTF